ELIRPIIETSAPKAEQDRQLSGEVHAAMRQAGLFAMMAPRARGGYELPPAECMEVFEAVARIDPAAAWNLEMNQAIACYVAWLSDEGADDIFRDGIPVIAGALYPPGSGIRVEGGWRITGRVPFGSGCHHADWLALPFVEMDGDKPRVDRETGQPVPLGAFFPRAQAEILDTWHTLGMRGTGSADYAVSDVFVPDHLIASVCPLSRPAPGFEGPLYRMWPLSSLLGESIVSVGVAATAVEAGVELCRTKTPAYNATPLREQQLAQFQLGKARSRVDAARDTLLCAAGFSYDDVSRSGGLLSWPAKVRIQLAACFAAEACAEAVRLVNDAVGTSSIRVENRFERCFRDAHTLLQHSDKSSARYASAGRLMLGLENDWVWLSF
ncbi:MAG TPA: acyl-CoA dehydrogenase family protein, partial [Rhodopila sp.]|nr:acyl-CoA dehydrogenase family protein [Rhodopila sp.]